MAKGSLRPSMTDAFGVAAAVGPGHWDRWLEETRPATETDRSVLKERAPRNAVQHLKNAFARRTLGPGMAMLST